MKGSVSLLQQARLSLGFCHVPSIWLVIIIRICHIFLDGIERDWGRCYLISAGNTLIKKKRKF